MKKIAIITIILLMAFGLSACGKKQAATNINVNAVPDTGTIVDVTNLNGQIATTTPGDIIFVKLITVDNKHQWSIASPDAVNYLELADHKHYLDQNTKEAVDDWSLKVLKRGFFELRFDYATYGKKAEKMFKINVVSQ